MSNLTKFTEQEAGNLGLGQRGSILVTGTTATTSLPASTNFVAIQFLEDTIFSALTAETTQLFPDTSGQGTLIDADAGATISGVTFPQGMTIYGRWTGFTLTSTGSVIAYIG